jgi:nicotinamidase/pyrazinamidase
MKLHQDTDILIITDVQNDFCPGGRLAVPEGDQVVPVINEMARKFRNVLLTQDWHPAGHSSFASSHPGNEPFTQVAMPYGPQTLWPDHCVQGSTGARLRDDLDVPHAELIIRKGFRREIDSYSAFFENDHQTPTGLAGYLHERGFKRVFCVGLAFDFCVRYSAEDARTHGFDAVVVENACRAIDLAGSADDTRKTFRQIGVELVSSL